MESEESVAQKHDKDDGEVRVVTANQADDEGDLKHIRHGASELQEQDPPQADLDLGELVVAPLCAQLVDLLGGEAQLLLLRDLGGRGLLTVAVAIFVHRVAHFYLLLKIAERLIILLNLQQL